MRRADVNSVALVIAVAAVAKFAIHLATARNYGYFCDELYALAMSRHSRLGLHRAVSVYLCRGLSVPLDSFWLSLKNYYD